MKALLIAVLLAAPLFPVLADDTDAKEAVAFRKSVIGGAGRAALALKAIREGKLEESDDLAAIAALMAANAKLAKTAFSHDTRNSDVPTKAEDAIWKDWDDFSQRMDAYAADAQKIADFAAAGDIDGMWGVLGPGFRTHCGGCHRKYQKD